MIQVLAYLDPSTGSMAYQVAISGFIAATAGVRIYWQKIKQLFSRHDRGSAEEQPRASANSSTR